MTRVEEVICVYVCVRESEREKDNRERKIKLTEKKRDENPLIKAYIQMYTQTPNYHFYTRAARQTGRHANLQLTFPWTYVEKLGYFKYTISFLLSPSVINLFSGKCS